MIGVALSCEGAVDASEVVGAEVAGAVDASEVVGAEVAGEDVDEVSLGAALFWVQPVRARVATAMTAAAGMRDLMDMGSPFRVGR